MENRDIIPIFSSSYSIGRSTLNLEDAEDIKDNSPVSVFSIAKEHDLQQIFLCETSFSGFVQFYKKCKEYKKQGTFGIKLIVCENLESKTEESLKTESKIILWMKNSAGYKDLIKIYSKAATDGFYYAPRIDWQILKKMVTKNIEVSVPFYDSFLFNNYMNYDWKAVPDFGGYKPAFHIEDHKLPFTDKIKGVVENYVKNEGFEILKSHSVYYYKKLDFRSYLVLRCVNGRKTFNKPNFNYMSSDGFNFEEYLSRINL